MGRWLGRWRQAPMPNAYAPPPCGHRAVVIAGERTLECSCGWCHAVAWPMTSGRVNRARWQHYAAVDAERIARRLGVDVDSMLDQVVQARAELLLPPTVQLRAVEAAPPASALRAALPEESPFREPTGDARRAASARRASAIARVEAQRVLPRYTGGDG